MPLNAQITLSVLAHETSDGDISRTLRATPATYAVTLTDGTGANQAQVVWSDSRTATTTNENLQLSALSDARDGASVTVAFSAIKVIYVRNTSTTATLLIGGSVGFGGTPSSSPMSIAPGGCYMVSAPSDTGFSVAAGITTARFACAFGTCTYDVILIGEGTVS